MVQDLFFPKNCLNCHKEGAWLCESCSDSLFFINANFCPFCGGLCDLFSVCEKCRANIKIGKVFSALKYSDPLARKIIKNFKYRYIKGVAEEIEPLLRRFLLKYKNLIDLREAVLIPAPLFWYRECDRGYNQAEELAKVFGKILNLNVRMDLVEKERETKYQADISHADRLHNLKNSFLAKGSPPKNIILVDDVFTTGSTLKEIASVLSEKGAEKIQAITLARG